MRPRAAAFLLAACASASGAEVRLGDWTIDSGAGADYLMTINESGSSLGKQCDADVCYWIMLASIPCVPSKDGSVALFNTSNGAFSAQIFCEGKASNMTGIYRYGFGTPDTLDTSIAASDQIGIAVAAEGNTFRVFKFATRSLAGAMRELVSRTQKRTPAVKDSTL